MTIFTNPFIRTTGLISTDYNMIQNIVGKLFKNLLYFYGLHYYPAV